MAINPAYTSFITEGCAVSKPAYIAEWRYPFVMTDKYGDLTRTEMRDAICYQYRAGQFKITVNGEPGAISSSDNSRRTSGKLRRGRTQLWPRRRLLTGCRVR
jgi:hypothetical protein